MASSKWKLAFCEGSNSKPNWLSLLEMLPFYHKDKRCSVLWKNTQLGFGDFKSTLYVQNLCKKAKAAYQNCQHTQENS